MDSEEFEKITLEKSDIDYGIFPPPTEAQEGLNVLIKHFLGEEWYVMLPLSQSQVNTEAVYEILRKYPKKKSLKDLLKNHSKTLRHNTRKL